jgi:Tfp pilus assembly PilM family ATPase
VASDSSESDYLSGGYHVHPAFYILSRRLLLTTVTSTGPEKTEMTKQQDITSTEKLLERIRQEQSSQTNNPLTGSLEPEDAFSLTLVEEAPPIPLSVETPEQPRNPLAAQVSANTENSLSKPRQQKKSFSLFKKQTNTVGIELKVDGIGLALVTSSGKATEQTTFRFIPYETAPFKDEETLLPDLLAAPWFAAFLQKHLNKFCTKVKTPLVWCGLPRESVKVHNVTIPKVPDNEIANSVFWSMQKEEPFERDETIIDFDLVKEIQEDSFTKFLTIVYLVRRPEVESLEKLFKKIDFTLTGVSTPTVALQNEIRRDHFNSVDESFSRLVIGENKSFIELYFRNTLVFSRDIKTGISSFVDSLMEMAASRGVILSEDECRKLILAEEREAAALAGGYGLFTDGETDIFSLELPAPVRLLRQMERTFDYYQNNFHIPRCSAVYLSGISFSDTRLAAYLSSGIGIPCHVHTPFATLSQPANITGPARSGGGYRLVAAFDMALSEHDVTRNFLVPRAAKEKQQQEKKVNKVAILSTAILLLVSASIFFWQHMQIREKKAELQAITAELSKGVFADENQANTRLLTELGKLKNNNSKLTTLTERYFPTALLGQIIVSLPPEIKLLSLSLEESKSKDPAVNKEGVVQKISMEGIVTGNRSNMEFILAKFIRKLTDTSFILSANVIEKSTDKYMSEEVLTFTIQVKASITEKILLDQKGVTNDGKLSSSYQTQSYCHWLLPGPDSGNNPAGPRSPGTAEAHSGSTDCRQSETSPGSQPRCTAAAAVAGTKRRAADNNRSSPRYSRFSSFRSGGSGTC